MKKQLYPIGLFLKHKPNSILLSLGLFMQVLLWIYVIWYIRPQDQQLFLHYTMFFGVDLIGSWYMAYIIPLAGFCMLLLNSLLGWFMFSIDRLAAYLFLTSTIGCHVFLGMAAYMVVFLNI